MTDRARDADDHYDHNVFVNCPFDAEYLPLFEAIVFTILDCRRRPRCALEVVDSGEVRIEKIVRIIRDCRLGVHDISRTESDPAENLPRFNMPLELGLFLGAKAFGGRVQKRKRCLILDRERYRFQKYCSDIAGQDVEAHSGQYRRIIRAVRNWLRSTSGEEPGDEAGRAVHPVAMPGDRAVLHRYEAFRGEFPKLCEAVGLDLSDLDFGDLREIMANWIKDNPWVPGP